MILGGWRAELEEEEVLNKARKLFKDLDIDIDLAEALMPGKNKGFLIVPMLLKDGEDRARLQRRVIHSTELVSKAALPSGGKDRKGNPSTIWMAVSESPEQRRKTRQLSKSKRCVLEIAEKHGRSLVVRAQYKLGVLWMDDRKITGAGAPLPNFNAAARSEHGWLDSKAVK